MGGQSRVSARARLDYASHRLTGCNVSQVTLLDMDSLTWCNGWQARLTNHYE